MKPRCEITTSTETFASFCRRHGDYIVVEEDARAASTGRTEPAASCSGMVPLSQQTRHRLWWTRTALHPVENGKARRRYVAEKLRQEQDALYSFMKGVQEQAQHHLMSPSFCPPPPADWKEQEGRGRARIAKLEQRLAELDEILEKLDPEIAARRARQEAAAKQQQEARQLLDEISARIATRDPYTPFPIPKLKGTLKQ